MSLRERVRNSDKLREVALRVLSSERLNRNPVYRSIYNLQIYRRMRAGLKRPESVDIENSSFCNARCIMCAHPRLTRKKGNMLWATYKKVVREAVEWGVPRLYMSGFGEAFIDKSLSDKIRFAKDLGAPWVGILTNGSLLSDEVIERILSSGLDELSISMDGFSPETFNKIRVGLDFDQVVGNINRLLERRKEPRPKVQIQVVLLPENLHEKEKARQMWRGRVDSLAFRQAQNWAGGVDVRSEVFTPHTVENNKLLPCRYLWTQLNVRHNGDVVMCCVDWDSEHVVGNVHEQSLREIWGGFCLTRLRHLHLEGRIAEEPLCEKCDYFSVWW